LDEPTNDLDSSSIEGLVSFLKESLASCLIVSHDKDFLNNVTKKIFEISDNKIIQYSGNYDFYEQQKTLAYQQGLEAYMRQEEEALRIKKTTQELKQKASNI
jgi:ATP-binding cassette subfamily F protein 3